MRFNEYIIYVDESGDHSLDKIDKDYPIFSLAFCIFKKNDYCQTVTPALQGLKFKWFGHDGVVLHEREIVKKMAPFSFLRIDKLRNEFMDDLNIIVSNAPMRVVASAIRKDKLKQQYAYPENPYRLALLFCLERAYMFLAKKGHHVDVCHVVWQKGGCRTGTGVSAHHRWQAPSARQSYAVF